ncbi:putative bifunctional diguanylate cyclase/phosphodiesterase [Thiohalorhabdus sp. Cl-TMA]|uniref:Bifunctional diguanylate cyclase/phosphodiesterase n=1 Tax=Thiohalorhabdus methylotrophus TaxID=3242694 RepID=A0ABV4TTG2_9GAMM
MGTLLLFSITTRLIGVALALWLLLRDRRLPFLLLAGLTTLMAARQTFTLLHTDVPWRGGPWETEVPGLLVSFLVLGVVLASMRLLREDNRQFSFWDNVSREAGFAFAHLDPHQTLRRISSNIRELLGHSPEDLEGLSFRTLTAPESPLRALPARHEAPALNQGLRREAILRGPDGQRIPVHVFVRFLDNPLHGCRGYSLVIADRRQEVQARDLQETISSLAREAEELIANEGWGLVHIAEHAARALSLERITIWWFSPDHQFLRCAENFHRTEGRHTAGEVLNVAETPLYLDALRASRVLVVENPGSHPHISELRDTYIARHGITALLNAPILIEGRMTGVVCFEHTGEPRTWNESEIAFAGSIADLVALARTAGHHRQRAEHLAHQAYLDPLTGLMNWQHLQRRLQEEVDREAERAEACLALLYIDLDQFRYINDTLGHETGDHLLAEVAKELIAHQPADSLLGRVGGDEFVLAVPQMEPEAARTLGETIRQRLAHFGFDVGDRDITLSASIGIAPLEGAPATAGDLLARADLACSQAKEEGRNRVTLYAPGETAEQIMSERLETFHRIRNALNRDRFRLLYQPIRGLGGETGDFHEALLRMEDGDDLLPPGAFLPTAERFSLMGEIDRWVVRNALAELAVLRRQRPGLTFSVNLSARAFNDQPLFDEIRAQIHHWALDPASVVFEITETEAIANIEAAKTMIWTLKEMGCRFSLDDFGSGFASFAYLRELPVDLVKIDGRFIRELAGSTLDHAIVRALVDIADTLGKEVVAEFVENGQTLALLRDMGVHYGQGYYLGRPAEEPAPVLRRPNLPSAAGDH